MNHFNLIQLWNNLIKRFVIKEKLQQNTGKVEIYKEWDNFPSPAPRFGKNFFYQESDEVHKLSHWIRDTNGGSVLIGGVRGVGKTAFAYYAIHKAHEIFIKDKFNNPIIFIPVNLSSLHEVNTNDYQNNRLALLIHLIQSYFYSSKKAKKQSEKLYSYSIADEYKIKTEEKKEKSINLSVDLKGKVPLIISLALTILMFILTWLFPSYHIYQLIHISLFGNTLLKDIRLSLVLFSTFNLILFSAINWSKKENLNIELSGKNFNFLQMSFQQLLSPSNKKIYVFVIDEIDKLPVKEKAITDLLQDLKNLLTISSGRFIFIATEEYYDFITGEVSDKNPYPISSTIFNSQIYIPQARINDVHSFLKSILKNKDSTNDNTLKLFAYYVYAMSGGVFAKVKNVIRDFLIYEHKKAYLILDDNKFDQNKKRIGRLSKIFDNIYKQSYTNLQSEQRYQHKRHEALYAVLKEIIQLSTFGSRDFSINILCELHGDRSYNKLTDDKQKELVRKDVRELLEDIKIRATHGQTIPYNIPQKDTDTFTFSITMNQIQPDLEDLPSSRDELTEIEKKLQNEIKNLDLLVGKYNNNLKFINNYEVIYMLGDGIHAQYDAAIKLAKEFAPSKIVLHQEVQNRIEEIIKIQNELSDELKILQKYIILTLKGLEIAEEVKVRKQLSILEDERINKILSSFVLFKYNDSYLIITKSDRIRIRFRENLQKYKIPSNIAVILIRSDIKKQFTDIGFNTKKVIYSKIGIYLEGVNNLVKEIKETIDWKEPQNPKIDVNTSQSQGEVSKT